MFETVVVKWRKILTIIMVARYYQHTKNGPSYKDKWGLLMRDFFKIVNYMLGTSHNQEY
jgi:hypothetical protein